MPSEKVLSEKKAIVAALAEKIKTSGTGVLVDYKGLTVAEDTELRKALRAAGVEYAVVKNTLTGFALKEAGYEGLDEDEAMQALIAFIGDDVIVGHNVSFDYSFMKQWAVNKRIPLTLRACDTLRIARAILPGEQSKKLEDLCVYYRIERERAHRALDDAVETHRILECMMQQILPEKTELLIPRELTYKAKRQTPATAHQIERLREYRAQHDIHDEINWEYADRQRRPSPTTARGSPPSEGFVLEVRWGQTVPLAVASVPLCNLSGTASLKGW